MQVHLALMEVLVPMAYWVSTARVQRAGLETRACSRRMDACLFHARMKACVAAGSETTPAIVLRVLRVLIVK